MVASGWISYLWLQTRRALKHQLTVSNSSAALTSYLLDAWCGDLAIDPLPTYVMSILILHDSIYRGCVGEGHETETSRLPAEFVENDHGLVNLSKLLKEGLELGLSDILR